MKKESYIYGNYKPSRSRSEDLAAYAKVDKWLDKYVPGELPRSQTIFERIKQHIPLKPSQKQNNK